MKYSTVQNLLLLTVLMLLPYSKVVASVEYNYIPDKDGKNGITITTAKSETTITIERGSIGSDNINTCYPIEGTRLCYTYEKNKDNTISFFIDDFLDAKASAIRSDSFESIVGDFFIFVLDISIIGDGFGTIITPWYESFLKKGSRSTKAENTPKGYTNEQCREKPCQEEYSGGKTVTLVAKPEKNSSLTAWNCSEGKPVVDEKRYEVTCEAKFDLIPSLNNEIFSPKEVPIIPTLNSVLRGGVFIEKGPPQKTVELNPPSKVDTIEVAAQFQEQSEVEVDIKGTIEVDAQHQGQSAEILAVGSYVSPNSQEPIFYMRDGNENIALWDKDFLNLLAFKTDILLIETQQLTLYKGQLLEGYWEIYFGYRLTDDSIIYNSEPIKINITP